MVTRGVKKAIRFLLILLSFTAAYRGRLNAAAKSLEEAVTSNMWSWEYHDDGKIKTEPIRFYRDGTAKNLKFFTAHWEIESPHSLVLHMHGMKATLTFNEDFTHYEGTDFHGKIKVWGIPGEGVDPNYTLANPTKPSEPVKSGVAISAAAKPLPTSIEILSEQAPNALEWALAPLNRKAPPDIRQNLTFLREDLLDEAVKKPAVSVEAYRLAQQLCNMLIGTLDERDKMLVRAGYTAAQSKVNMGEITNQALEARRSAAAPSGWHTSGAMAWPTYQREKDQREELRKAKQNAAALERQRPVLEWADRGEQIRKMADLLYAQYRDAARQPASNGLRGAEEAPQHPGEAPLESRLSGTR